MINKAKNGFTLVELMVAMVVGLIVIGAIYTVMNTGQGSSAGVGRKVLTQQDTRAVLDLMAMEISMASYNPRVDSTIWSTGPLNDEGDKCDKFSTFINARKGIQVATANNILVAMDLDGDKKIGYPGDNEYIGYTYDETDEKITRSVSCGNNESILVGADMGTKVVNGDSIPLFQYFNADGADISTSVISAPDATAGNGGILDIRRIRITIVADVETQGEKFKTSTRTYTTDVLVRNHVLSP